MPNEFWYWEKHVPEDLIDAVKHIRDGFEDDRWKAATVTQHCCYAALHPELNPSDRLGEYLSALTVLKAYIGPLGTRYFHDLLKRGTPSAILAAFFHFYKAAMAVQVNSAFRDLIDIGQANAERLEGAPIGWADWQVRSIINNASYQTGLWLKRCCDVESFDSDDFDSKAGEEEEQVWTNWRAPRFAGMQPSLGLPYDALRVWEREDVESSKGIVKAFKQYFVIHLKAQLKDSVGAAHLEAAKSRRNPTAPITQSAPVPQPPAVRRRTPRKKPLCYSAAAIILRKKTKISPREFCKLMDGKAQQHPKEEKYKPPTTWGVETFFDQYRRRSNTVSKFLTDVRRLIKAQNHDSTAV